MLRPFPVEYGGSEELGFLACEAQVAQHGQNHLSARPLRTHEPALRMTVRPEKQVADLVGHRVTKDYRLRDTGAGSHIP